MEKNVITRKIRENLKASVKARDRIKVGVLRMLLSALKNAELDEREELSEEKELAVIASYARRCRESIAEFEKGGRVDLVEKEQAELEIVMSFLPEQLGSDDIEAEAAKIIEELGASGPGDIGRVMGEMMKRFKGRVDGRTVNRLVTGRLRND